MTHYEIITKLIGSPFSVGATHIDEERLASLDATCDLAYALIMDIAREAGNKMKVEYSMKRSGKKADEFLRNLYDELKERYDSSDEGDER